jgi:hypothetical protein
MSPLSLDSLLHKNTESKTEKSSIKKIHRTLKRMAEEVGCYQKASGLLLMALYFYIEHM